MGVLTESKNQKPVHPSTEKLVEASPPNAGQCGPSDPEGAGTPRVTDLESTDTGTDRQIVIDEEFRDLIPRLSEDEQAQLEESLKGAGCRDPLVAWGGHNILLDGHHRHQICTANGIGFEVRYLPFPDREAAMNWMILNQLGRRNLAPKDAALLRGKLYNATKKTKAEAGASKGQSDLCSSTAGQIAKQTGVSEKTVKRDAAYAAATEELGDEFDKKDSKAETIRKAKVKRGELQPESADEEKVDEPTGEHEAVEPQSKAEGDTDSDDAAAGKAVSIATTKGAASPEVAPMPQGDAAEDDVEDEVVFEFADGEHYVPESRWADGIFTREKTQGVLADIAKNFTTGKVQAVRIQGFVTMLASQANGEVQANADKAVVSDLHSALHKLQVMAASLT